VEHERSYDTRERIERKHCLSTDRVHDHYLTTTERRSDCESGRVRGDRYRMCAVCDENLADDSTVLCGDARQRCAESRCDEQPRALDRREREDSAARSARATTAAAAADDEGHCVARGGRESAAAERDGGYRLIGNRHNRHNRHRPALEPELPHRAARVARREDAARARGDARDRR
jgi:hypothetical protein